MITLNIIQNLYNKFAKDIKFDSCSALTICCDETYDILFIKYRHIKLLLENVSKIKIEILNIGYNVKRHIFFLNACSRRVTAILSKR